jgi:uncharacterized protein YndB with AHSA1/START domain
MFKKMAIVVVAAVALFLIYVAVIPGEYRIERSIEIVAPPEAVFAIVDDFNRFNEWSPWAGYDPAMQTKVAGKGAGATYEWSGNDKVGHGKITVTKSEAPSTIEHDMHFITPYEAKAKTAYVLSAAPDHRTKFTWSMDGTNNFMAKMAGVFMDMQGMLESDFDRGLKKLKAVAEKDVVRAEAEAAKAEAEAEPAPASDAGPPAEGG